METTRNTEMTQKLCLQQHFVHSKKNHPSSVASASSTIVHLPFFVPIFIFILSVIINILSFYEPLNRKTKGTGIIALFALALDSLYSTEATKDSPFLRSTLVDAANAFSLAKWKRTHEFGAQCSETGDDDGRTRPSPLAVHRRRVRVLVRGYA
jgi:hypothetical protein